LKILVACEFSGTVRDAFAARGHDAWSCDLLPSEKPGNHRIDDVSQIINEGWDLMIAHPPCTHLAVSGARWFKEKEQEQRFALAFVRVLLNAKYIDKICLENPISIISSKIRKPDQIIQPWMFGHPESKATCLWLKGLPLLKPTNVCTKEGKYWSNQTPSGQNKLGPSPDRWKLRSITYQGIADAMAEQWGEH
jgi:site-specific DNA-cytosine methylase